MLISNNIETFVCDGVITASLDLDIAIIMV